jgi:hypothetical protein
VDPVPGPLLLRKSGSAGNRTRDVRDRTLLQKFKAGFGAHPASLLRVPGVLSAEVKILSRNLTTGAWGSVVVKALRY